MPSDDNRSGPDRKEPKSQKPADEQATTPSPTAAGGNGGAGGGNGNGKKSPPVKEEPKSQKPADEQATTPSPAAAGGNGGAGGGNGNGKKPPPEEPKPVPVVTLPNFPASTDDVPRGKAGLHLSNIMLGIIGGSIAALLGVLLLFGYWVGHDVQIAYSQILNPSRIGSEFYTLGRLEHLEEDFNSAKLDANWQMTDTSRDNEKQVMEFIKRLPSVTAEQKSTLDRCNPIPTGAAMTHTEVPPFQPDPGGGGAAKNVEALVREDILKRCISVLNDIRQAALEAAASTNNAQIAAESVDKMLSHRQSFFTFWIQAAQLILLNLLLPILTGLFGYIFGTQRGS